MAYTIITKHGEKTVQNREVVNISSKPGSDIVLNFGFDYLITIQYDKALNRCTILNPFNNPNFLFKGAPMGAKIDVTNVCKIMVANSDEFIGIKVIPQEGQQPAAAAQAAQPLPPPPQKVVETVSSIAQQDFTKDDIQKLYGNVDNAETKIKIDKNKQDIEKERVAIIKQVAYKINDLKNKISMGSKSSIVLHIGLFFASLVCAFGLANYLTGLPLKDAGSIIQMPTNLKLVLLYSLVIFGIGFMFKQGVYLYFQNRLLEKASPTSKIAENFMIYIPLIMYVSVYFINVLYYISGGLPFFAILISLFFVTVCATLAAGAGYFKSNNVENQMALEQYEYREDFEKVIKDYQRWIERFINSLSSTKLKKVKEKILSLQMKSMGETALGIITAPFLAYGVSNTLAMCFPEAAGWIRISGLRLSPVFLVLATFLIIFAFFSLTSAFVATKRVNGAEVIKKDGFNNFMYHGVDIFGTEAVKKLKAEGFRSFMIAMAIIAIEFTMNVSYFMKEIGGGEWGGIFLSVVSALVPTALLVAETFMLSHTKYEIHITNEILSRLDKDI